LILAWKDAKNRNYKGYRKMENKNYKRSLLSLVILFFLLSAIGCGSVANASSCIATVNKMSGMSTVVRQGRTLSTSIGLEIYEGDTIHTGADGSIGLIFSDDTLLSLGPGSVLIIDEFLFAPKQGKYSIVIRMLKGTAAYLSGLISRFAPESAHFKTPNASIGIRGTKFIVKVEGEQ
jgi:hypothetical protein